MADTNTASIPMPVPTSPLLPLSSYKVISFDVYGTLVQYKSDILRSFKPLISRLPSSSPYLDDTPLSSHITDSATTGDIEFLKLFQRQEDTIKLELAKNPARFDAVLREIWKRIAVEIDVQTNDEEIEQFGSQQNVESWRVFEGTIEALEKLQDLPSGNEKYRLVALSNIDRWATKLTFKASRLGEVKWDKVFTAEDFGTSAEDLKLADQRKFEKLLSHAKELNVEIGEILHVAQSLGHDHKPANDLGIASVFLIGDGPVWGKEAESRMAVEKGLVGYGWRCKNLSEFAALTRQEQ